MTKIKNEGLLGTLDSMTKIEDEGLEVTLDIETVESVTVAYLKEMYVLLQKNISEFIRARVDGEHTKNTTLDEWKEYNGWHTESERIRKFLMNLMQFDDYNDFLKKTYDKFYHVKKK